MTSDIAVPDPKTIPPSSDAPRRVTGNESGGAFGGAVLDNCWSWRS